MSSGKKRKRIRKSLRVDSFDLMSDVRKADPAAGMYRILFPLAYFFTLMYIFTVPFENAIVFEGVGSISRGAGILILGMWVLLFLLKQTVRSFIPFFIFTALFVVWCSFSIFWSRHPDVVTVFLFTYVQLFVVSYFLWLTLIDQNRCVRALQIYLAGGSVAVGFIFWNFYTNDLAELGTRVGIEGVDLNELAMSISLGLPVAWYLATRPIVGFSGSVVTIASYVFLSCGILAIMMTGSRAGFVSIFPTVLYILISLFYVGRGARIFASIAIVVSIIVVVQYVPEAQFARILTFSEEIETGEISGRGDLWRAAIQIWLDNPLNSIIGIGIGSFGMEVGMVSHSTYLGVLTETGVLGFGVFLAVLLSLLGAAMRSKRDVRYMLLALLMTWGIGASTLTWEYAKLTWLVWSLIVCIAYAFPSSKIVKRRRRTSHRSGGVSRR